jgi:hypothetical protein
LKVVGILVAIIRMAIETLIPFLLEKTNPILRKRMQ